MVPDAGAGARVVPCVARCRDAGEAVLVLILIDHFFEAPDVIRHIVAVVPAGDAKESYPYLTGLGHAHDVVRGVVGVVPPLRGVVDQVVKQRCEEVINGLDVLR